MINYCISLSSCDLKIIGTNLFLGTAKAAIDEIPDTI